MTRPDTGSSPRTPTGPRPDTGSHTWAHPPRRRPAAPRAGSVIGWAVALACLAVAALGLGAAFGAAVESAAASYTFVRY